MLQASPPFKRNIYPDIVYILYEPVSSPVTKRDSNEYKYKNAVIHSSLSYINACIKSYLIRVGRPRSFDMTASCSNLYDVGELEYMPEIHIYSSIPLNLDTNDKVFVHDIQPIIDLCPVDVFTRPSPYIPALKAATLLYHSHNSDQDRPFILADADIIFYEFREDMNPNSIYLCGIEYQPLFSFLCFRRGLKVWSNFGNEKKKDMEEYRKFEKHIKMPMQCQIFNNGIMHVPKIYTKRFFDIYYEYLIEMRDNEIQDLTWPWPFWTAEMFASNYAAMQIQLEENVPVRRFDPDVMSLVHDINAQYAVYFERMLNL